jgi:hypothetical protein
VSADEISNCLAIYFGALGGLSRTRFWDAKVTAATKRSDKIRPIEQNLTTHQEPATYEPAAHRP